MKILTTLILFVLSISYAIFVEYKIRTGKIQRINTYSYKSIIKLGLRGIYIISILIIIIYFYSKSIEITITLGVLFLFCLAGGCLYGFLLEYQTKRRGGKLIK